MDIPYSLSPSLFCVASGESWVVSGGRENKYFSYIQDFQWHGFPPQPPSPPDWAPPSPITTTTILYQESRMREPLGIRPQEYEYDCTCIGFGFWRWQRLRWCCWCRPPTQHGPGVKNHASCVFGERQVMWVSLWAVGCGCGRCYSVVQVCIVWMCCMAALPCIALTARPGVRYILSIIAPTTTVAVVEAAFLIIHHKFFRSLTVTVTVTVTTFAVHWILIHLTDVLSFWFTELLSLTVWHCAEWRLSGWPSVW